MNNSSLSYYNIETGEVTEDIFLETNGRGLGDIGNDLRKYGSKMYCVMNGSERVEIMSSDNARSIGFIPLTGKGPRRLAFHNNFAYVSCTDGSIICIDTTTLEIAETLQAGMNPEGICIAKNKLYVANSGGMNYPNYNNTVSIFDLSNHQLIKEIEVPLNPYKLAADKDGEVYLASRGNYADIPYSFYKIDTEADLLGENLDMIITDFTISGNFAYLFFHGYFGETPWIKMMDITSDEIIKENFISDGTYVDKPYAITINPKNEDLYVSDPLDFAVNGNVFCFDRTGKKKFEFEAGIIPSAIVIR